MSLKNLIALSRDIYTEVCTKTINGFGAFGNAIVRVAYKEYDMCMQTYQSFANKFLNSFCNALLVSSPEYILCHVQRWILTATVLEQIVSRLVAWWKWIKIE